MVALYSSVPSVTSTTRPPGVSISSGSAKWLVIACVSTPSRSVCSPMSSDDSQTVLFHSIVVGAPDVVHEDVQGALLALDPRHERAHLVGDEVVDLDGDAAAARRVDERRGLLDRLGPVHLRALASASCAR